MITTDNLFDLRRTINGLGIEIERMGVIFNPMKSKLMMKNEDPDRTEIETTETYGSTTINKLVTFPNNVTKLIKKKH